MSVSDYAAMELAQASQLVNEMRQLDATITETPTAQYVSPGPLEQFENWFRKDELCDELTDTLNEGVN